MMRAFPLMLVGHVAIVLGCASVKTSSSTTTGAGASSGTGSGGSTGSGGTSPPPPPVCNGMCTDFPADPIIDATAPTNAPTIFGAAGGGNAMGGPCLLEPVIGALFPNNWLRPRFRVAAASGQDLFEIRLHAGNQANDLVVYTDSLI